MAKDRADLCEKRAEMAQERAADLERSLRDAVLHVEWLENELATTTKRGGGGEGGRSDSATVAELTDRLRRVELNADKRAEALEERLRQASERAMRAESRCAKAEARADKAELDAKRAREDGCAGNADPHHPRGSEPAKLAAMRKKLVECGAARVVLQAELDAMVAWISRKHGVTYGDLHTGEDRYRGFRSVTGTPHVFGKCSYSYGDVYVGEWNEGQPHGWGRCTFNEAGKVYEGGWAHGGYHGKGTYSYPSGETFEGEWRNDKRHGTGKFTDKNGVEYIEVYKEGDLKHRHVKGSDATGGSGAKKSANWTASEREGAERQMMDMLRQRYEAKWKEFETNPPQLIDYDDVPWPPPGNLLEADEGKSTTELKRRCKEFIMRWHPDKWQGKPLAETSRERIMEEVTNVFRRIDAEKQKAGL